MSSSLYSSTSPLLSSLAADRAAVAFTELKWPNNPFHEGEIGLQQAAGMQEHVMSYAPTFVRNYMPDQHREFYTNLPFLVGAARDPTGAMWSTLLEKPPNDSNNAYFVTSPNDRILHIQSQPVPGDALYNAFSLQEETDLGILGIELETKRRNRVNGRAIIDLKGGLKFVVDQSFGNCPQYIKPRTNWYREVGVESIKVPPQVENSTETQIFSNYLTPDQVQQIHSAETVFTASGYRGQGEDVRFGNDASHRGGPPGFMRVDETEVKDDGRARQTIVWTEYPGNNHFNTLGNIVMDPRVGISIPQFATGGILQVSGTATVEMGKLQDGGRKVRLLVSAVNELPAGSLPIRWTSDGNGNQEKKQQLIVSRIVQESEDVKSFYLEPADVFQTLPSFQAGQHLPIELTLENGELIKRTYSLSSAPQGNGFYRISVKKRAHGAASNFMHNQIHVGDTLSASHPAGDFVRITNKRTQQQSPPPIVLLSAGIGVTPMLSMLHEIVGNQCSNNQDKVVWMHGARNSRYHPFREEIDSLLTKMSIESHIFYSQPDPTDMNDSVKLQNGHINADAVRRLIPSWKEAVYYMCGPPAFLADLQSELNQIGVDLRNIYYETF